MTPAEKALWEELRANKLGVHFRRQQVVQGFIVDFYCHQAALVIEVDGDQFGARALADGTVEVYRNGGLLATCEVASWSHYADGGYVGLWFIGAEDAVLDDFGGGTISIGIAPMNMAGSTFGSQPAETSLTAEQLNVTLTNVDVFWQGAPIGSKRKTAGKTRCDTLICVAHKEFITPICRHMGVIIRASDWW